MKKSITSVVLAALVLFTIEAIANEQEDPCIAIHGLAEDVMDARQNNLPMPSVIAAMGGEPALEAIVRAAYEQPAYSVPDNQRDAVRDFANNVARECYGN